MDKGEGVLEEARAYIREALRENIEDMVDQLLLTAASDPKFSKVVIGLMLDLETEMLTTIREVCDSRLSQKETQNG